MYYYVSKLEEINYFARIFYLKSDVISNNVYRDIQKCVHIGTYDLKYFSFLIQCQLIKHFFYITHDKF